LNPNYSNTGLYSAGFDIAVSSSFTVLHCEPSYISTGSDVYLSAGDSPQYAKITLSASGTPSNRYIRLGSLPNVENGGIDSYSSLESTRLLTKYQVGQYIADSLAGISVPAPSSTTPAMDGTGAIGTSSNYARADHVHPTDTSRAAANAVWKYATSYTDVNSSGGYIGYYNGSTNQSNTEYGLNYIFNIVSNGTGSSGVTYGITAQSDYVNQQIELISNPSGVSHIRITPDAVSNIGSIILTKDAVPYIRFNDTPRITGGSPLVTNTNDLTHKGYVDSVVNTNKVTYYTEDISAYVNAGCVSLDPANGDIQYLANSTGTTTNVTLSLTASDFDAVATDKQIRFVFHNFSASTKVTFDASAAITGFTNWANNKITVHPNGSETLIVVAHGGGNNVHNMMWQSHAAIGAGGADIDETNQYSRRYIANQSSLVKKTDYTPASPYYGNVLYKTQDFMGNASMGEMAIPLNAFNGIEDTSGSLYSVNFNNNDFVVVHQSSIGTDQTISGITLPSAIGALGHLVLHNDSGSDWQVDVSVDYVFLSDGTDTSVTPQTYIIGAGEYLELSFVCTRLADGFTYLYDEYLMRVI